MLRRIDWNSKAKNKKPAATEGED